MICFYTFCENLRVFQSELPKLLACGMMSSFWGYPEYTYICVCVCVCVCYFTGSFFSKLLVIRVSSVYGSVAGHRSYMSVHGINVNSNYSPFAYGVKMLPFLCKEVAANVYIYIYIVIKELFWHSKNVLWHYDRVSEKPIDIRIISAITLNFMFRR